jgi:hypothetical protein
MVAEWLDSPPFVLHSSCQMNMPRRIYLWLAIRFQDALIFSDFLQAQLTLSPCEDENLVLQADVPIPGVNICH